ncbi:MAG: hypothetical protein GQ565_02980 [Candidatus Aegiribacteria sp.]|nr:hypothetical protein [Candidatus Aegiribacteria sp.]
MSVIDRIGHFRGEVVDRGLSKSSGGFMQLELQLRATEMYDLENGVWVPWGFDECEAHAYMILFGRNDKATRSVSQIMKALGWDGLDFAELQDSDKLSKTIQWRMGENTYEGNTTIRCEWISEYDAAPGQRIEKLGRADIQQMQAKYASQMHALSGGPKPKGAPKVAPLATTLLPGMPISESPTTSATVPTAAPSGGSTEPPEPELPFVPDVEPIEDIADAAAATLATCIPVVTKPKRKKKVKPIDMTAAWTACMEAGLKAGKTQVEITAIWTGLVKATGPDGTGSNETVGDNWLAIKDGFSVAIA